MVLLSRSFKMLSSIGKISLLVMSVLISAGGIAGFLKAKSKPSLIADIVSGGLLATAYSIASRNEQQGLMMGAAVCALLCVVFGIRLAKTKKVMPSGMLLALSAIELILLACAILIR